MIDTTYLINLDKRPDRLNAFIAQSTKSNIIQKYTRVSAIDGSCLSMEDISPYVTEKGCESVLNNRKTKGLYLSKGAAGLAITYKSILERCVNTTLLLEDDIIIDSDFDKIFYQTWLELPVDWDILYLGWYFSKNLVVESVSTHVNKLSGQINGTQGWVVNPQSAQKILNMFPITYQIDTELYANKSLNKYATIRPIINRSLLFKSDIQN